ncbi:MAG: type II toxin-antitoxin system MqsA family antitoxin [Deltaproteobacteria bacterium]|nr:type II toxin-antitoxin system MqsA family antitoxin [Deltaproteobacteria bacterium]MBW2131481.1 type II toxin-antitoxin system MqsA family antitoxin [Deltaproteobacteria bacterium]
MKPRRCPICGAGILKKRIENETFVYKGKQITIPNYITHACNECGEAIVDPVTLKESGKQLKEFKREVDGLLTGAQIKAIRRKLGMTQEELAEIIGGGLKSVARYESGKICQSKGMDNLLRILDAYPETLKVIQKNKRSDKSFAQIINIEVERNKRNYRIREETFSTGESGETAYGI